MTSFLIFDTLAEAAARSHAAYISIWPENPEIVENAIWISFEHPTDGRGALEIPDTPAAAGIGVSQAVYDALLTTEERAALITSLTEDWFPWR